MTATAELLHDALRRHAARHGLPVALVAAIVQVESAAEPWAVRFEPAFYDRYIAPLDFRPVAPCSRRTEGVLRACSFGPMQVMGQVARELGFLGAYLTELCDPDLGIDYGCRHLANKAALYWEDCGWEGVAAAYNAGKPLRLADPDRWANQPYIDKIKAAGGFR